MSCADKIHELMQSRVQNHSLMVAGTTAGHLLPGLKAHHDYAVVGYDSDKQSFISGIQWGGLTATRR